MCPQSFKKSFSIVQVSVSKPITFTAGKLWKVNLDSFVKVPGFWECINFNNHVIFAVYECNCIIRGCLKKRYGQVEPN